MLFSGFEKYLSGIKKIKMPDDDAIKKHSGRKNHGSIKFDLRQKIKQKREKMIDGEHKLVKGKKILRKSKPQKRRRMTKFNKKFIQKKTKINIPCKFGDACKFKPNYCRFLHTKEHLQKFC